MKNFIGQQVSGEEIKRFCRKYGIRKFSIFGSVLSDDFRPESDIDVLVEFGPGQTAGFLKMARMELELTALFGRKADIRTPAELSRYFRVDVMAGAEVQSRLRRDGSPLAGDKSDSPQLAAPAVKDLVDRVIHYAEG